jgi:hypothetical protein
MLCHIALLIVGLLLITLLELHISSSWLLGEPPHDTLRKLLLNQTLDVLAG